MQILINLAVLAVALAVVAALGDKDEVQQTLLRSLKARIEKVKGASYA